MTASYSVHVCQFPGNNVTHPDASDWIASTLVKMKSDPRISRVGRWKKSDTPITMVRNDAVKEALALGADYILMIDSDMGPDYLVGVDSYARPFWDVAWEFMMNRRKDEVADLAGGEPTHSPHMADRYAPATIAAPYCGPPPKELPYIFRWKNWQSDHPEPDYHLQMIEREDAAHRAGIEEVAALPTGLILYDARVFKVMREKNVLPWFDYEYEDQPFNTRKSTTEDVFQTRNASMLGLPQFVAWDCWPLHYKLKPVPKPSVLTQAQMRGVMRNAFEARFEDHDTRILMVNRHDPKHRRSVVETSVQEPEIRTIQPGDTVSNGETVRIPIPFQASE